MKNYCSDDAGSKISMSVFRASFFDGGSFSPVCVLVGFWGGLGGGLVGWMDEFGGW